MPSRLFLFLGFLGWFGFGSGSKTTETADSGNESDTGENIETAEEQEKQETQEIIPLEKAPVLFGERERPILLHSLPENMAGVDASSCIACHSDITTQWKQSAHRNALRNPNYQKKIATYANSPLCSQCHAPLQLQHFRLAESYVDADPLKPIFTDNPNWDAVLASESVGCASCHIRDGKILGIEPNNNAPHNITVSEELSSSSSCASCHQFAWKEFPFPMYNTFEEWRESPQAGANIQCQDCHMPPKATSNAFAEVIQASHHFRQSIEQALSVSVDLQSPIITRAKEIPIHIQLRNIGAGHFIPTGNPWKQYTLILSITDEKGKDLITPQQHIIGRIQDKEGNWKEDNRIPTAGSKSYDFTINIPTKKNSGPAMLSLILQKSKEETVLLWDIPVKIQ